MRVYQGGCLPVASRVNSAANVLTCYYLCEMLYGGPLLAQVRCTSYISFYICIHKSASREIIMYRRERVMLRKRKYVFARIAVIKENVGISVFHVQMSNDGKLRVFYASLIFY